MNVNNNLTFTTDISGTITQSDAIFICVNTPPKKESQGGLGRESDMKYLYKLYLDHILI